MENNPYFKIISTQHTQYYLTLNNVQQQALIAYVGAFSDDINTYLRQRTISETFSIRASDVYNLDQNQTYEYLIDNWITSLKQIIYEAPSITQPIVVYRGIRRTKPCLPDMEMINNMHLAFISTSFSLDICVNFIGKLGFLLKINLPENIKGIYTGYCNDDDEQELLLNIGYQFKVINQTKYHHYDMYELVLI